MHDPGRPLAAQTASNARSMLRPSRQVARVPTDFEAGEFRAIGIGARQRVQRVAARGQPAGDPRAEETGRAAEEHRGLQDSCRRMPGLTSLVGRSRPAGRSTVATLPGPSERGSRPIAPPISSTARRAIARPRPVPCERVVK